jgi:hypothetical protein
MDAMRRRPTPPPAVRLAAAVLLLGAAGAAYAVRVVGAGNAFFGHAVPREDAPFAWLVRDPFTYVAAFRWEMNADAQASVWMLLLIAGRCVVAALVARGVRAGRHLANASAATALGLSVPLWAAYPYLPALEIALLVLLNRRSTREFFAATARWRGDPARMVVPAHWPAVVAVLCLVGAAVAVGVVLPAQRRLGTGTLVQEFDGVASLTDLAAGGAMRRDVPVSGERTVEVDGSAGDLAAVRDAFILKQGAADWAYREGTAVDRLAGPTIVATTARYTVDRRSRAGAGTHSGLRIGWPAGVERRVYTGWVPDTGRTVPLRYSGEAARTVSRPVHTSPVPQETLATYAFQATAGPAPIADPQVLARLPRSVPATTLSGLGAVLAAPDRDRLAAALAPLAGRADAVAVDYTYEFEARYEVEPVSGVVVAMEIQEVRRLVPRLGAPVPGLPVQEVRLRMLGAAPGTMAWDARDRIRFDGRYAPASLLLLALACGAGWVLSRRPRPARPREPSIA